MSPFWLFLIAGVGLLVVELLVFQFTTFWLFFVGLGALVAALFAWLVPSASYLVSTMVFVVASAIVTAVFYRPLRNMQKESSGIEDNNAIGHKVTVTKSISADQPGEVTWSGSNWQAELADINDDPINAGDRAVVVAVEGIRLLVESQ